MRETLSKEMREKEMKPHMYYKEQIGVVNLWVQWTIKHRQSFILKCVWYVKGKYGLQMNNQKPKQLYSKREARKVRHPLKKYMKGMERKFIKE